jgi:Uncharacterized protein conserved in archaea (DUF2250)
MKLKESYILASCCHPGANDAIIGYYSYDKFIKVHKSGCGNLGKAEKSRLIKLEWPDIIAGDSFIPGPDYALLDDLDFRILNHHRQLGIDYSLMVAATLQIDRETAFERHSRLLEMGLLQRVSAVMVQYRKNIVRGKWIKHRNHTYYDLTEKGNMYLNYFLQNRR